MQLRADVELRLAIYEDLLRRWQKTINLVSHSSMAFLRTRHFNDSLQIAGLVPTATKWVDMGSGAGFPGLITAIQLADQPNARVHLIESDSRKCAFLREVSRETKAPAIVHCGRIENVLPTISDEIEAVSARALAPLSKLIELSRNFLLNGATGVFPKGREVAGELTGYALDSRFKIIMAMSKTDPDAQIVLVTANR